MSSTRGDPTNGRVPPEAAEALAWLVRRARWERRLAELHRRHGPATAGARPRARLHVDTAVALEVQGLESRLRRRTPPSRSSGTAGPSARDRAYAYEEVPIA